MGILDAPALTKAALTKVIAPITTFPATANNGATSANTTQTPTQTTTGTSRCPHFAGMAHTEATLTYSNFYVVGAPGNQGVDTVGLAPITISAAIEVDFIIYPLTFAGAATVTIQPGAEATSDPIPGLTFYPGQLFFSRTYINAANWRPNRTSSRNASEGGFVASVDRTTAGSASIPDSISAMFVPSRIGGKAVNGASLVGIGDSIMFGAGELNSAEGMNTGGLGGQAGGFVARAAYGRAGFINLGRGGDRQEWFIKQQGHQYRLALARGCTHAIEEYGINDISGGLSLSTLQTNSLNLWQVLASMGMKVGRTTILPSTSSTDGWATLANQTPNAAKEAVRVPFNTWLRAGAPVSGSPLVPDNAGTLVAGMPGHPLTAVFDTAASVESSLNSGKFRVDQGTPTSDGTHPWTPMHILMAGMIPASFFAS